MHWNGGKKGDAPVAFVGKGVSFDTGGISIKPAAGMEDMKGDMAGAACVVGLMHALAARKARSTRSASSVSSRTCRTATRSARATSSPRCRARPSRSSTPTPKAAWCSPTCSGTSQERFKPKVMVDLATLTGAIMVALGQEHAGLFSNNDELPERLTKAGSETGELVWRMPLGPEYDKMIDSKVADMKNTGGPLGRRDHRRAVPPALRRTTRRGRISTSPAPAMVAARPRSTGAGARAGAFVCSTDWWRSLREVSRCGSGLGNDRGPILSPAKTDARETCCRRCSRNRSSAAGESSCRCVEERIDALDAHLWTYRDDGFLPHGTWREPEAALQPVLLTLTESNPNAATVRFLIDGAPMPPIRELSAHRTAVRRRGRGRGGCRPRALDRGQGKGFDATYWQTDEQGAGRKRPDVGGWPRDRLGQWMTRPMADAGR